MRKLANPSRRRNLAVLAVLPLLATGAPFAAQAAGPKRLGFLAGGRREEMLAHFASNDVKILAALGWIEGKTIEFIWRIDDGDNSRIPALARELVEARPDVICTGSTVRTRALQQLTRTIPIVTTVGDPVGSGFAQSLARPGGNITGLSIGVREIARKQVELLRAVAPKLETLAIVGVANSPAYFREIADPIVVAAQGAGVATSLRQVTSLKDVESALRALPSAGRGAAYFLGYLGDLDVPAVMQLAIRLRVPAMAYDTDHVGMGGLLGYTLHHEDENRNTFAIVDKLLRGADPAVTPFQLPTKSIFAINRRTAAAIGVTFPPDFLLRADEIIG